MIHVLLPAFNEEPQIAPLLEGIRDVLQGSGREYRIVLVDDGSSDNTAAVAARVGDSCVLALTILRHPVNQGLAAALRTGLGEIVRTAAGEDVVITMDADNTHPPGLMPLMADRIAAGSDLVVASRYRRGSRVIGVPLQRRLLSDAASIVFRLLFPLRGVRDYTCGYRAYRAALLGKMHADLGEALISERGFSCMADLLLKARAYSPVAAEVPLVLRYDLKQGQSKMKVGRTVRDSLLLILKRRFTRLS